MLRLKQWNGLINPAHIESIHIVGKEVIIGRVSESSSIRVNLETAEDAISFATYVELLVDISNTGRTDKRNEAVRTFESYFEWKDILTSRTPYRESKRLGKLLMERNRKS